MPPKAKYSRADVIEAAFRVTRAAGPGAVNARAVAKELGSSTQPLFRDFASMDELKSGVLERAAEVYAERIENSAKLTDIPYMSTGLAYIRFAREEPELFKLLFMRDTVSGASAPEDKSLDYVLDRAAERTGFTREEAREFHLRMWIFTHGLAVMVATKTVNFSDADAKKLLSEQFLALKDSFIKRRTSKTEG